MEIEKRCRIYYNDDDSVVRYLKDSDIIDGHLTEAGAFKIFYNGMILSNNYIKNNYEHVMLLTAEDEDDGYPEEYQYFLVDPCYDEDVTIKATKNIGNTLYYDDENEIYITGITDLGMSRDLIPTNIKVEEVK